MTIAKATSDSSPLCSGAGGFPKVRHLLQERQDLVPTRYVWDDSLPLGTPRSRSTLLCIEEFGIARGQSRDNCLSISVLGRSLDAIDHEHVHRSFLRPKPKT